MKRWRRFYAQVQSRQRRDAAFTQSFYMDVERSIESLGGPGRAVSCSLDPCHFNQLHRCEQRGSRPARSSLESALRPHGRRAAAHSIVDAEGHAVRTGVLQQTLVAAVSRRRVERYDGVEIDDRFIGHVVDPEGDLVVLQRVPARKFTQLYASCFRRGSAEKLVLYSSVHDQSARAKRSPQLTGWSYCNPRCVFHSGAFTGCSPLRSQAPGVVVLFGARPG